ncbi:hypothetical protein SSS_00221 [Sarcoptes scabiei]|uniref:Uncharacterized protein n=1 Tax=Sarcoptes scabiei TaxID=52283 RepID=A0A834VDX9_SARSC|nr:hypothetical protein SSS_00221 [Sarcoptes scabiei]
MIDYWKFFQRAPLGICRSIEKNLNTKLDHESFRLKFIDCLQTIYADDQNDLKNSKIYCCQKNVGSAKILENITNVHLVYEEYCCSYSELMSEFWIPLSFIAILMAINFLWILVNLSFNFYLILISTIDSKRFIFKREFLKSKPRFPSFGRVDEILRSKNPMIRLKLEFDLDQIDRSTPTPKPTRTINQQLRTSLTSFEMVSRRFQSKQIKF